MATNNGYNGSTDFESWFKQVYGTDYDKEKGFVRMDGMSDGDWDVGTVLHNHYLQNQKDEADRLENAADINTRYDGMIGTARAGYDSSRKTLAENKNVAQQNASVTYDKLKRYLPMRAQAQGLGGLGAESDALEAYNTYMSNMGKIGSDYNSDIATIDAAETEHIGELERYRTDALSENDSLYDGLARSRSDAADTNARSVWDKYIDGIKDSQTKTYDTVYDVLETSVSTNADELIAYVEQHKGKMSDEQYAALVQMAKNVAEYNGKQEIINGSGAYEFASAVEEGGYSSEELQAIYDKNSSSMTEKERIDAEAAIAKQKEKESANSGVIEDTSVKKMGFGTRYIVTAGDKSFIADLNETGDTEIIMPLLQSEENKLISYNNGIYTRIGSKVYEVDISDEGMKIVNNLIDSNSSNDSSSSSSSSGVSSSTNSSSGNTSRPIRPGNVIWSPEGALKY